ncbi:FKBP-type peptidyl-prolyl cis-trans isomerase [Pelotalea chapellei]|uniref:Peptidyl-prolyl cis-trans isomerase n=1 Tax=Pelotalea chapellei TaxID=44671 RepID=A0ABS5U533_9BACT|nr:FKBP-type peptidyl-prolyl cis-trans isomerase [Pelotalea chapellei]MBT1070772.1 FKBP-type peptidyl-prolyl cis-trans isomerase [Pelotalea chapellei]
MEADTGKKVAIHFTCRYEDGTIYEYADRDVLEFIIGEGNTIPSLEKGVIGMHPGDTRVIPVSAAELKSYPFELGEAPLEMGFPAGTDEGTGDDEFAMDEDDQDLIQPDDLQIIPSSRSTMDLFFDVEMVAVDDVEADVEEESWS